MLGQGCGAALFFGLVLCNAATHEGADIFGGLADKRQAITEQMLEAFGLIVQGGQRSADLAGRFVGCDLGAGQQGGQCILHALEAALALDGPGKVGRVQSNPRSSFGAQGVFVLGIRGLGG